MIWPFGVRSKNVPPGVALSNGTEKTWGSCFYQGGSSLLVMFKLKCLAQIHSRADTQVTRGPLVLRLTKIHLTVTLPFLDSLHSCVFAFSWGRLHGVDSESVDMRHGYPGYRRARMQHSLGISGYERLSQIFFMCFDDLQILAVSVLPSGVWNLEWKRTCSVIQFHVPVSERGWFLRMSEANRCCVFWGTATWALSFHSSPLTFHCIHCVVSHEQHENMIRDKNLSWVLKSVCVQRNMHTHWLSSIFHSASAIVILFVSEIYIHFNFLKVWIFGKSFGLSSETNAGTWHTGQHILTFWAVLQLLPETPVCQRILIIQKNTGIFLLKISRTIVTLLKGRSKNKTAKACLSWRRHFLVVRTQGFSKKKDGWKKVVSKFGSGSFFLLVLFFTADLSFVWCLSRKSKVHTRCMRTPQLFCLVQWKMFFFLLGTDHACRHCTGVLDSYEFRDLWLGTWTNSLFVRSTPYEALNSTNYCLT